MKLDFDRTKKNDLIDFLLIVIFSLILLILKASLLKSFWLWFLVPITNVEPINFLQALGIYIFLQFVTMNNFGLTVGEVFNKDPFQKIFNSFLWTNSFYFIGYILHWFM